MDLFPALKPVIQKALYRATEAFADGFATHDQPELSKNVRDTIPDCNNTDLKPLGAISRYLDREMDKSASKAVGKLYVLWLNFKSILAEEYYAPRDLELLLDSLSTCINAQAFKLGPEAPPEDKSTSRLKELRTIERDLEESIQALPENERPLRIDDGPCTRVCLCKVRGLLGIPSNRLTTEDLIYLLRLIQPTAQSGEGPDERGG